MQELIDSLDCIIQYRTFKKLFLDAFIDKTLKDFILQHAGNIFLYLLLLVFKTDSLMEKAFNSLLEQFVVRVCIAQCFIFH